MRYAGRRMRSLTQPKPDFLRFRPEVNNQNARVYRETEGGATEKWCPSCSHWKLADEFNRRIIRGKVRWRSKCRACESERYREYQDRKRSEKLAQQAETQQKFCGGCDRELPIEAFSKHSLTYDGFQSQCRECKALLEAEADIYRNVPVCGPVWTEDEASWKQDAACKDRPGEWWLGEPYRGGRLTKEAFWAKQVCDTCPVVEQCRALNDAIEDGHSKNQYIGIWAGETIPERMKRRKEEGVKAA